MMARRRRSTLALSGAQAQAGLAALIQEGKLVAGVVRKALQRRDRLIKALRAGDLILTGTPAGIGPLASGDSVGVEIGKVGVLQNPVSV